MKKLRCGKIYFSKVSLKRARKYCIKSRARKCANKSFRYRTKAFCQEPVEQRHSTPQTVSLCELDIKTHHDFGEVHSVRSEPYYYECAYDFDFEPGEVYSKM